MKNKRARYYFAYVKNEADQVAKAKIFKSLTKAREYLKHLANEQHSESPSIKEYGVKRLNKAPLFEGEQIILIYQ